jgi:ATP-dependent Clp protease ATP-binding subunit ClpA
MFERFTDSARGVLVTAQDLAVELDSRNIDVGHLLYGCAEGREDTASRALHDCGITAASIRSRMPRRDAEPGDFVQTADDIDPEALRAIGIDFDGVQAAVEATFGPGALEDAPNRRLPARGRRPPFTTDAKRCIQQGLRVAVELHHDRIAPGHLLLGLLRLDSEFVSSTVVASGSSTAALSAAVLTNLAAAA